MINTNELMIGNYVHTKLVTQKTKNHLLTVKTIGFSGINKLGDVYTAEFEELYGIPITKEWLIKLGFQKESTFKYSIKLDENVLEIEYDGGDTEYSCYLINYHASHYVRLKDFQYVHELQNLYFALTGEQLKIKK